MDNNTVLKNYINIFLFLACLISAPASAFEISATVVDMQEVTGGTAVYMNRNNYVIIDHGE